MEKGGRGREWGEVGAPVHDPKTDPAGRPLETTDRETAGDHGKTPGRETRDSTGGLRAKPCTINVTKSVCER